VSKTQSIPIVVANLQLAVCLKSEILIPEDWT
jgi:hypothetical protein